MSVRALSSASVAQQVGTSSNLSKSQQTWQAVGSSLAAGNLAAAKSAFSSYQRISQALTAMNGGISTVTAQVTSDLKALGQALNAGDLAAARQSFASAQSDLNNVQSQAMNAAVTSVARNTRLLNDLFSSSTFTGSPNQVSDPISQVIMATYGGNSALSLASAAILRAYGTADTSSNSTAGTSTATSWVLQLLNPRAGSR